jgi:hypothetical protein
MYNAGDIVFIKQEFLQKCILEMVDTTEDYLVDYYPDITDRTPMLLLEQPWVQRLDIPSDHPEHAPVCFHVMWFRVLVQEHVLRFFVSCNTNKQGIINPKISDVVGEVRHAT